MHMASGQHKVFRKQLYAVRAYHALGYNDRADSFLF